MRSAYRILKELRSARDQFYRYFKNCVRSAFSDLTFGLRSQLWYAKDQKRLAKLRNRKRKLRAEEAKELEELENRQKKKKTD